jgi:hypothetical protein
LTGDPARVSLLASVLQYTIHHYGDICSLAGLVLTILVYRRVSALYRYYVLIGRLPKILGDLRLHGTHLIKYHGRFASSTNEILLTLGLAKVTLQALRPKLPKLHGSRVDNLIDDIQRYTQQPNGPDALYRIYVSLEELIEHLKQMSEDIVWDRQF